MKAAWYKSRFTGLFLDFQRIPPRAHDPQVSLCAGVLRQLHPEQNDLLHVGGCDWSDEVAETACLGEGLERLFAYPTDQDATVESSYEAWSLAEPAVAPERWVLFHPQQYACCDFPFEPLNRKTRCRWVCFRDLFTGEAHWVPEEFAYLLPREGGRHRFCPATSTGLAAGTAGQPVVLRALQEVTERDALLGAWWGTYPLEEFRQPNMWGARESLRLRRPNLRWRFFRIQSPFSEHVTMVTVEGEDREGFCHSIGSACRESRHASWTKSILEAVQGRHFVRHLRPQRATAVLQTPLKTFEDHAVYFSFHPDELERTVLHRARLSPEEKVPPEESLAGLGERLASMSSVLVRNLTPPMLHGEGLDWRVVKVIVPGLQPLHGDDRFAHLGGALWLPRNLEGWSELPPHPFP